MANEISAMRAEVDRLATNLSMLTTVREGVETLLQRQNVQLRELASSAGSDPAAQELAARLHGLADAYDAATGQLATALTQNTPAAAEGGSPAAAANAAPETAAAPASPTA